MISDRVEDLSNLVHNYARTQWQQRMIGEIGKTIESLNAQVVFVV